MHNHPFYHKINDLQAENKPLLTLRPKMLFCFSGSTKRPCKHLCTCFRISSHSRNNHRECLLSWLCKKSYVMTNDNMKKSIIHKGHAAFTCYACFEVGNCTSIRWYIYPCTIIVECFLNPKKKDK
jgi:hypothetical protein